MEYTIRTMTIDDYDDAICLWKDTEGIGLSDSDSKRAIASYLERNAGLSFVASNKNKLVGAVLCGHDGRRGYLHHLAVDRPYRRKGVGRALVEACLSSLARLGIQKCNIFLYSNNLEASAFWTHSGWLSRNDLDVMQKVIKIPCKPIST
jgi:ribosomal protein S18 acetylase RimI-like enzyme